MALPLIFFPSLVTSSLSTTLVPAISEAVSLKNFRSVNYRISKSIQITFVLGFIFTAVFLSFPDQIGSLIYRKERIGDLLYLLSFTCVLAYLSQILTGVMNGLGKQGVSLGNSIIGSIIRIGFVYFAVPRYGISSYVLGFVISFALMCLLNLVTVVNTTGLAIDFREWILKPGGVCIVMLFSSKYIYHFFNIFTENQSALTILALLGIITAGAGLMFAAGVLKFHDLKRLTGLKTVKNQ
jgi:stage V sporulation protein B